MHIHPLAYFLHYALTHSISTTTIHQYRLDSHQSMASFHLLINGLHLALNSTPPSKYIPTAVSAISKQGLFYPLAVKRKSEFILFSRRLNEYPNHC